MGLSEGGQKRRANLVFGMFHLPYFVLHSLLKFFSRAFAALSERLTNRGQFHHRYFVQIVDWFAGEPLDDGDATFPHCASAGYKVEPLNSGHWHAAEQPNLHF